jgi:hypothetical protein
MVTGADGRAVPSTVNPQADGIELELADEVIIPEGKSMTVVAGAKKA